MFSRAVGCVSDFSTSFLRHWLTLIAYAAINDVQDTLNHEHGKFSQPSHDTEVFVGTNHT